VSLPNRHGRISSGISANAAALKTVDFIQENLAAWRDDPERPHAERERELNSQLCKYLNVAAKRTGFAMVYFHHEEPQGDQHSADISANPVDADWIEGRQYTKYDPILLLEGKRLPTPGSGRAREYVSSGAGAKPMGGVQRFKLGLHGGEITLAAMIGYVQRETCSHWFAEINKWIDELATPADSAWLSEERLRGFRLESVSRVSRSESEHSRATAISPRIRLTHLWVEMSPPSK
jgi:hypothetical protein